MVSYIRYYTWLICLLYGHFLVQFISVITHLVFGRVFILCFQCFMWNPWLQNTDSNLLYFRIVLDPRYLFMKSCPISLEAISSKIIIIYIFDFFLTGSIMVGVVIGSRKCSINPDNVATPIAASLGDLTTLVVLASVSSLLFDTLRKSWPAAYRMCSVWSRLVTTTLLIDCSLMHSVNYQIHLFILQRQYHLITGMCKFLCFSVNCINTVTNYFLANDHWEENNIRSC